MARVSTSGFYKWIDRAPRSLNDIDDLIKKTFDDHKEKIGYRQVKMFMFRDHGLKINHKRIKRSMKLQKLFCKIRRKKPNYGNRYISKLERAFPNHLSQNFNIEKADNVYSGDVTEIRLRSSLKIYMYMVKGLRTKEIVSHNVSTSPDTSLVLNEFKKHLTSLPIKTLNTLIYHTDQGGVFMSDNHISLMKKFGVTQSMSRRGNCLDNSPIESFFGHMKDYVDFKSFKNLEEVIKGVNEYVDYYNYERPQWTLKKMTPVEYRSHLNF